MAGGTGSRFWPMSTDDNPKQFIDILGLGESMLQATFRRFESICPRENIVIVTSVDYAGKVREQIPNLLPYQVLCEPSRRNTAPCIAYAASVIYNLNPEAVVVVSPSDHAIFGTHRYADDIGQAVDIVAENEWIVLVGVRPTNPNTKYGYVQFSEKPSLPSAHNLHKVVTFTEKPPVDMARQFIASGEFFWNAGIFVWKLSVLSNAYKTYLPNIAEAFRRVGIETSVEELNRIYSQCETISVDNGIMEKADNVHVLEASFGWSDVETWDSLYNTVPHNANGNAFVSGKVFDYDVHNCVVHLPADKTLVLQGLSDYIVAGDENTILICRRDQEDNLFKYSSDVEMQRMKEQAEQDKSRE